MGDWGRSMGGGRDVRHVVPGSSPAHGHCCHTCTRPLPQLELPTTTNGSSRTTSTPCGPPRHVLLSYTCMHRQEVSTPTLTLAEGQRTVGADQVEMKAHECDILVYRPYLRLTVWNVKKYVAFVGN